MKKQVGFTLIELIIVIIILGILAAYAVPKYMSIDKEARVSVVRAMNGTLLAAADMVHAVAVAKGAVLVSPATTTIVTIAPGQFVTVGAGLYPIAGAGGIRDALADFSGFDVTGTDPITFEKTGAPTQATCSVSYNATVPANPPVIILDDAGC